MQTPWSRSSRRAKSWREAIVSLVFVDSMRSANDDGRSPRPSESSWGYSDGKQHIAEDICNVTNRSRAFSEKLKYSTLECLMGFEAPVSVCVGDRSKQITVTTSHLDPYLRSPLKRLPAMPTLKPENREPRGHPSSVLAKGHQLQRDLLSNTDRGVLRMSPRRSLTTTPMEQGLLYACFKGGESEAQS